MKKVTLYGIPNCDSTIKAIKWLKQNNINFVFHDYKQSGISKEKLQEWNSKAGWESFFNKRSTTWRELSTAAQNKVTDFSSAIKIMMENSSIIKRPIIEFDNEIIICFVEKEYQKLK